MKSVVGWNQEDGIETFQEDPSRQIMLGVS